MTDSRIDNQGPCIDRRVALGLSALVLLPWFESESAYAESGAPNALNALRLLDQAELKGALIAHELSSQAHQDPAKAQNALMATLLSTSLASDWKTKIDQAAPNERQRLIDQAVTEVSDLICNVRPFDENTFGKLCDTVKFPSQTAQAIQSQSDALNTALGIGELLAGSTLSPAASVALSVGGLIEQGLVGAMANHLASIGNTEQTLDLMLAVVARHGAEQAVKLMDGSEGAALAEIAQRVFSDPNVKTATGMPADLSVDGLKARLPEDTRKALDTTLDQENAQPNPVTGQSKAADVVSATLLAKIEKNQQTLDQALAAASQIHEQLQRQAAEAAARKEYAKQTKEIDAAIDLVEFGIGKLLNLPNEAKIIASMAHAVHKASIIANAFNAGEIGTLAATSNYIHIGMKLLSLAQGKNSPEKAILDAIDRVYQKIDEFQRDANRQFLYIQAQNREILSSIRDLMHTVRQGNVVLATQIQGLNTKLSQISADTEQTARESALIPIREKIAIAQAVIRSPEPYRAGNTLVPTHDGCKVAFLIHALTTAFGLPFSGYRENLLSSSELGDELRKRNRPELCTGLVPQICLSLKLPELQRMPNYLEWVRAVAAFLELRTELDEIDEKAYLGDAVKLWKLGIEISSELKNLSSPDNLTTTAKKVRDDAKFGILGIQSVVAERLKAEWPGLPMFQLHPANFTELTGDQKSKGAYYRDGSTQVVCDTDPLEMAIAIGLIDVHEFDQISTTFPHLGRTNNTHYHKVTLIKGPWAGFEIPGNSRGQCFEITIGTGGGSPDNRVSSWTGGERKFNFPDADGKMTSYEFSDTRSFLRFIEQATEVYRSYLCKETEVFLRANLPANSLYNLYSTTTASAGFIAALAQRRIDPAIQQPIDRFIPELATVTSAMLSNSHTALSTMDHYVGVDQARHPKTVMEAIEEVLTANIDKTASDIERLATQVDLAVSMAPVDEMLRRLKVYFNIYGINPDTYLK